MLDWLLRGGRAQRSGVGKRSGVERGSVDRRRVFPRCGAGRSEEGGGLIVVAQVAHSGGVARRHSSNTSTKKGENLILTCGYSSSPSPYNRATHPSKLCSRTFAIAIVNITIIFVIFENNRTPEILSGKEDSAATIPYKWCCTRVSKIMYLYLIHQQQRHLYKETLTIHHTTISTHTVLPL